MDARDRINDIMNEIEEHLQTENDRIRLALGSVLDMIFWNNGAYSFATMDDKCNIINSIMNGYKYVDYSDGSGYYNFENDKELRSLINQIRKNMGLWDCGENPPKDKQIY